MSCPTYSLHPSDESGSPIFNWKVFRGFSFYEDSTA
ncbi:hypothetical protein COLO4_03110 [Corchorus olitorius]|uniref:Uncharacterized protein n=1 Tax=Corchorus olitorius TaxID=93759 RepID=A0A1R3KZL6_9ROSI|nr:hypothetical protein COLO4_03110 [Corchorus olitorius]